MEKKLKWSIVLLSVFIVLLCVLLLFPRGMRSRPELKTDNGIEKMRLVLEQIKNNYVDDVDILELVDSSLPAIFENLDPHSAYLPPEALKASDSNLAGNFDGVGIIFNVPNDTAVVINVVSGGPSERAGIQSGDRIIKVDTTTIAGRKMAQDSMKMLMRGPRGSKVRLGILRMEDPELVYFDIQRDKIPEKSVDVAYMLDDSTGYIKLTKFAKTTYREVFMALSTLSAKGMKSLVFDLRGNLGGYLDQALMVANEFLMEGQTIVYTEGAHRVRQDFKASKSGLFGKEPMAVIIDENSASSSEILAGALQDNDRSITVGRRSFGKGLVQEPLYFTDESGIRLTVARFYTPTGRCIQKPYGSEDRDVFWERYRHGELTQADSIPHNDSLKYTTPKGKVVYGGGGIIPDVFVPLDTTGTNDLYVKMATRSLPVKFGMKMSDIYRRQLVKIKDISSLNDFFSSIDLEKMVKDYAVEDGIIINEKEWQECRYIILTQCKAFIGRTTPLDDEALYYYLADIDNVLQKAVEALHSTSAM